MKTQIGQTRLTKRATKPTGSIATKTRAESICHRTEPNGAKPISTSPYQADGPLALAFAVAGVADATPQVYSIYANALLPG